MTTPKKIKPPTPGFVGTGDQRRIDAVPPGVAENDTLFDPPVKKGLTRADFKLAEFTRVIEQKGLFCVWRKATICPCLTARSNQPHLNCALCDGSGWYYIDPLSIRAIVLACDKNQKMLQRFGVWLEGAASITTHAKHRIGYYDSIEMKDSVISFNEVITKGNRKGIRSKLPTGVDSLRYRAKNIIAIHHLKGSGATATAVRLKPDADYVLTKDGWLEWRGDGAKLTAETQLSVSYEFSPTYVVVSHPHTSRDTVIAKKAAAESVISMPVNAMAKLDYLLDVNTPLPVTGGLT